jgi:haloalkane dehalogenase
MWRETINALANAGWHAVAPDFPGYGDSEPDPPGTWARHVAALERFVNGLALAPVLLVTHDWGALIGLRWASAHPDSLRGLVVSNNGGFFADRGHHELATAMRTRGTGERLMRGYTRRGFDAGMRRWSPRLSDAALDEYWKAFSDDQRRLCQLDLYRSADFTGLSAKERNLASLDVPALIIWGANDPTAGTEIAERYSKALPGSQLVILHDAGHYVWEDAPQACAESLLRFLERELA